MTQLCTKKTLFILAVVSSLITGKTSFADWSSYEETNIKGVISGVIQQGKLLEMQSGSIYKVSGLTIQVVVEVMPEAVVLQDRQAFKLIIEGFDEPVICEQVAPPAHLKRRAINKNDADMVESRVDGTFRGWDGETIVPLANGQIWQQAKYKYAYKYRYRPKVTIFKTGKTWMMLVEGMDAVPVKRLK